MAKGSGKGKADQTGMIAAGCGAIYCMVCFFVIGLPMLIAGIVLVRFAAGDYDDNFKEASVSFVLQQLLLLSFILPHLPKQTPPPGHLSGDALPAGPPPPGPVACT